METIIQRRKIARKELKEVVKNQNNTLAICYSHASYQNENDEISPMITAIVIRSLNGNIYEHFGVHIEADLINCTKQDIKDYYPELELSMLEKFNDFMKRHTHCYWVHWDMININYGFQAIKHRYIKLAGDKQGRNFYEISNNMRVNLNTVLVNMYGENYASNTDPLLELLKFNSYEKSKYLSLHEEENEFFNLNFSAVANSIDLKANSLCRCIRSLINKKLRIPSKNNYSIFLDVITHPLFHLIGWIATILGTVIACS
jgi:hypothetical protein